MGTTPLESSRVILSRWPRPPRERIPSFSPTGYRRSTLPRRRAAVRLRVRLPQRSPCGFRRVLAHQLRFWRLMSECCFYELASFPRLVANRTGSSVDTCRAQIWLQGSELHGGLDLMRVANCYFSTLRKSCARSHVEGPGAGTMPKGGTASILQTKSCPCPREVWKPPREISV